MFRRFEKEFGKRISPADEGPTQQAPRTGELVTIAPAAPRLVHPLAGLDEGRHLADCVEKLVGFGACALAT